MSDPAPTAADRRHAPATERNREPILAVLREVLPATGLVLEIASGTGEHARHFAGRLPGIVWQPSDPDPENRASIAAWMAADPEEGDRDGGGTLRAALPIDVHDADWGVERADAVVCINMIHIAPWSACLALFRGAAALLPAEAPLCLYGPFMRDGVHTAPSNASFDESLRRRNPDWGIRDLGAVEIAAGEHGFALDRVVEMPANNLSVVFRRR